AIFKKQNKTKKTDREERNPLLNPVANPSSKASNGADRSYTSIAPTRTDEQALLSSILTKTALNLFSVRSVSGSGWGVHGYRGKRNGSILRMVMLWCGLDTYFKLPPLRLWLSSGPLHLLSLKRRFCVFLFQVAKIAAYAFSALSQVRIDAKEELVVQFAIP
uniref:Ragulator complex protein LAMTOR1 n=1 Tax=Latimeria chalumnae TaxID=7897 RepID=H3AXK0_LATCH